MQQQLTRLRGAWSGMPTRAQYAIMGVAVVTVLVMFLVLRAATSTEWVPVASDLPAEKLGEAETALEEAGIEHRLSDTGTAIEVAKADAPKAASALIPAGIAAKGGRAGCAKQSEEGSGMMAQTSAQHALMLETCRENDAANTIEAIDGVSSAKVDVTQPGESLFEEDEQAAKAAVLVDLDGSSLPKKSIEGIQRTVAAGFEGLEVKNVTVTDESGAVIGGDGDEDEAVASMRKLNAEARFNAKVEKDLLEIFEQIAGPGNVAVKSNVELDMDAIERGVRNVEAAGEDGEPLVQSEAYKKELLNGSADTGVQGVAGTPTNQGVDPDNRTVTPDVATAADGDEAYVGDENSIIYDHNIIEEKIGVAPGSVLRHRIPVVIDDDVDEAAANAIKNAAQAWMGGNAQDSFSYDVAPLASAKPAADTTAAASTAKIAGYVKWALLGLGLIGLAFVLRRTLTQRTAELLAPADDLLMLDSGEFTPIPIAELEAALAANQPSAERRGRLEMQKKVEQIAETKPHDVANELRRWMHQDDPGYAPARKAG
jgi:flagellar M-ring protein FliF